VSSGWKPVPTSSRLATRPLIVILPVDGFDDPAEELQECRFPGAVPADDAKPLAFTDLEADLAEGQNSSRSSPPLSACWSGWSRRRPKFRPASLITSRNAT